MNSECSNGFYRTDGYCAEESVGYLMKRVTMSIAQNADRRLQAHDLTMAQWLPLFKIHKGAASTVVELARESQTDVGATTRLLDRLEKKDLCRRVRSTEDRRVVRIELTESGQAVARKVEGVLADTLNAHLAGFSADEWLALKGYLMRMIDNGQALKDADAAGGAADAVPAGHATAS